MSLVTLGTMNSEIEKGNEKITVPTAQLRFGDQAEPDPTVASVLTKKTGFVTVREEADENAVSLGRIPDGMIVGVIEQGETFTKIFYISAKTGEGVEELAQNLLNIVNKWNGDL